MNIDELKQWFKEKPIYVQKASKYLIEKESLTESDYRELYNICIKEVGKKDFTEEISIPINRILSDNQSDGCAIKLNSISNVIGINRLSPKKPLNLKGDLVVIYGANGTGKSGYVRILQHASGKPRSDLIPNIYDESMSDCEQSCIITYEKNKNILERKWDPFEGLIPDLSNMNIFDSKIASSYIERENEVTYEPKPLIFFSKLIRVCDEISSRIREKIEELEISSSKPNYPVEYEDTNGTKWYESLTKKVSEEAINQYCSWEDKDQKDLSNFQKTISEKDPEKEVKNLRNQNKNLSNLIHQARSIYKSLSKKVFKKSNVLKEKSNTLKTDAIKSANNICEKIASLKGVGTESWKELWSYAHKYSVQEAYKGKNFPVTSENPRCVLCHQKLSDEAIKRFKSFNEFIKGEAQKKVREVEKELNELRSDILNIPDEEKINLLLNTSGLNSINNDPIKELFNALRERKSLIKSDKLQFINTIDFTEVKEWMENSEKTIEEREKQAQRYEQLAKKSDRDRLSKSINELKMKKWLHKNSEAIKEEIKRLKHISILNKAKQLTDTTQISRKKGELSEELVTDQLINRFNNELELLGARDIKVQLKKVSVSKGKVQYGIQLKSESQKKLKEILSEGEMRVVALSGFFAYTTGENHTSPFIFDDPISSLDEEFTKHASKRLVKLSTQRQVIVFTHRLTMFNSLKEHAKYNNTDCHLLKINAESWGTGEPVKYPMKITGTLNNLSERLIKLKKTQDEGGKDKCRDGLKAVIADFREVLENCIEQILLSSVIERYNIVIRSSNVKSLAKINDEDCRLIDDLMTRYSANLHSSPNEVNRELPQVEVVQEDIKKLTDWRKEFIERKLPNQDQTEDG